jgi:hypothetical protein
MEVTVMKLLRIGSATLLFLLLAFAASADAQEPAEHQDQKPEHSADRVQKEDQAQKKEDQAQKKEGQRALQNKDEKRESKPVRIPEDRFRANYGRQHVFHVNRVTVIDGAPRFVYGGYNFVLVEPWPAGWAYTDDCYIDYIDGEYFLFDLLHPGVRMAITVVL